MPIGQLTMQQLHILYCTVKFTTAQIVINYTLKYALPLIVNRTQYIILTASHDDNRSHYPVC